MLAAGGCGGLDEILPGDVTEPIFVCEGDEAEYRLHMSEEGDPILEIASQTEGGMGAATWLLHWKEVRVGGVTGQQGGSQQHLRLVGEASQYMLLVGEDGLLADNPGRTYAAVLWLEGARQDDFSTLAECDVDTRNRTFLDRMARARSGAGLELHEEEVLGGPYDGWF